MEGYRFAFKGGIVKHDKATFKFLLYFKAPEDNSDPTEELLFQAVRKGYVLKDRYQPEHIQYGVNYENYVSYLPIVKIFTSTGGFGVPKEYFSYFFLITPSSSKRVTIRPLGYDRTVDLQLAEKLKLMAFTATGRFLTREEIRSLYGDNSTTYRYYQRQAFLSKERLRTMVTVQDVDPEVCVPTVRVIR